MSDTPSPPPDDSGRDSTPPPEDSPSQCPQSVTGWATLGTGDRLELASPGARRRAGILDWAILYGGCLIIAVIWINPFGEIDTGFLSLDSVAFRWLAVVFFTPLLVLLVAPVYHLVFFALKGQALGRMIAGIKVVRADNGGPPGWRPSAWRDTYIVKA